MTWRTGRKLGRTVYEQVGDEAGWSDKFLGMMETRQLAEYVCLAVNSFEELGMTLASMPETEPYDKAPQVAVWENGDRKDCDDLPPAGLPVQRSIDPHDAGRAAVPMDCENGIDAVPQDDRAVPPVPPDADLPVVELNPGRDDTEPGHT